MADDFLDQGPESFLKYSPENFLNGENKAIDDTVAQGKDSHTELAVAVSLGVAFMLWRTLMKRKLQQEHPSTIDKAYELAGQVWAKVAPAWLRMASPALAAAYGMDGHDGMSVKQLEDVASEYALSLGKYLHTTSADALVQGFTAQLSASVHPDIAWNRVTEAFGLDHVQMKTVVTGMMGNEDKYQIASVTETDKTKISHGLHMRADKVGTEEAFNARQIGKGIVWMYQQQTGLLPQDAMKQWITAEDERVCPICGPLHEVQVPIDGKFDTDIGSFWAPALHINCFPAETLTGGPEVLGSFMRWYSGEMIDIRTASGKVLTVTPNHPILTDNGWVAAGKLNIGSQVVTECASEWPGSSNPYNNDHFLIEQIGESLLRSGQVTTTAMPITAEDFHGDGTVSEVDIVRTDSFLLDDWKADHICNLILQGRSEEVDILAGYGDFISVMRGMALAFDSGMSSFRVPSILFRSTSSHHESVGLSVSSYRDVLLSKEISDDLSRDTKVVSNSFYGFSGQVALDQVVGVVKNDFSGHVYNLLTDGGWYTANGFIVHNCRCSIRLVSNEPVSKAVLDDPYDRDPHGHFASHETRTMTMPEAETQPVVAVDPFEAALDAAYAMKTDPFEAALDAALTTQADPSFEAALDAAIETQSDQSFEAALDTALAPQVQTEAEFEEGLDTAYTLDISPESLAALVGMAMVLNAQGQAVPEAILADPQTKAAAITAGTKVNPITQQAGTGFVSYNIMMKMLWGNKHGNLIKDPWEYDKDGNRVVDLSFKSHMMANGEYVGDRESGLGEIIHAEDLEAGSSSKDFQIDEIVGYDYDTPGLPKELKTALSRALQTDNALLIKSVLRDRDKADQRDAYQELLKSGDYKDKADLMAQVLENGSLVDHDVWADKYGSHVAGSDMDEAIQNYAPHILVMPHFYGQQMNNRITKSASGKYAIKDIPDEHGLYEDFTLKLSPTDIKHLYETIDERGVIKWDGTDAIETREAKSAYPLLFADSLWKDKGIIRMSLAEVVEPPKED